MSTMLEQAVVDAAALREVAIKNAETVVIEKYADQIKEAVAQLLEQPEEELEDPMADPMADPMMGGEIEDPTADEVPLGAADGENLCPCPEEEDEIEINFDELVKQMEDEGELAPPEEMMMPGEEELEGMLEEIGSFSLEEEALKELVEELVVDIVPTRSGWAGTPDAMHNENDEMQLAREQDTKVKEENEALRKAVKALEEMNENMKKDLSKSQKKVEKFAKAIYTLKDRLNESNLSSARLLYTNKVLTNNSLNERQKTKLAGALLKAETVEETKVIYETLQNAVGSTLNKKQPKSLSEAVQRNSSSVLPRKNSEVKKTDPTQDRWKVLAGIK